MNLCSDILVCVIDARLVNGRAVSRAGLAWQSPPPGNCHTIYPFRLF